MRDPSTVRNCAVNERPEQRRTYNDDDWNRIPALRGGTANGDWKSPERHRCDARLIMFSAADGRWRGRPCSLSSVHVARGRRGIFGLKGSLPFCCCCCCFCCSLCSLSMKATCTHKKVGLLGTLPHTGNHWLSVSQESLGSRVRLWKDTRRFSDANNLLLLPYATPCCRGLDTRVFPTALKNDYWTGGMILTFNDPYRWDGTQCLCVCVSSLAYSQFVHSSTIQRGSR